METTRTSVIEKLAPHFKRVGVAVDATPFASLVLFIGHHSCCTTKEVLGQEVFDRAVFVSAGGSA